MSITLFEYQKDAIEKLRTGSILVGGVGSGKSRTALAYYFIKECGGKIKINNIGGYSPMKTPKTLYIITTARKRDTLEWEQECIPFLLSTNQELSINKVKVVIDSWNNIHKFINIKDSFFIFDEQRVIGNGVWVTSFLKIAKKNNWILLSATPGDTWIDYIPIFIANGYYKNRTDFIKQHVVYYSFLKYPKIKNYINVNKLIKLKNNISVNMKYIKKTVAHDKTIWVKYDKKLFNTILTKRWNVYEQKPVQNISELCYLLRKVVNSDPDRLLQIKELLLEHPKIIVFYTFNYEKDLLLKLGEELNLPTTQWNGSKHEKIPNTEKWMYIIQYTAGAEGWNCIETNVIVFFSQSYSYKTTIQAAGRIDRLNTPFTDLYYYYLKSNSIIDLAIQKAFTNKMNFNENLFMSI